MIIPEYGGGERVRRRTRGRPRSRPRPRPRVATIGWTATPRACFVSPRTPPMHEESAHARRAPRPRYFSTTRSNPSTNATSNGCRRRIERRSNANADDFSLDREVYRAREASFGTVDEAEDRRGAPPSPGFGRPPARRFCKRRATTRFRFGGAFASRRRVRDDELRAKNDELRWRRASRTRGALALAEVASRFEMKRELEEIEARRREQAAAKRRGRFGRRNFARCAWRTRGWSGACGASAWLSRTRRDARARAGPPNNLCISAWSARTEKTSRTSRNRNDARFWRRDARRETAAFRWRVSSDTSRRRTNEDARRRCVRTTPRFDRFRDGVVELPAIRSSSSVGADLNPHRVKRGDGYRGGRRGAMLPNLDEPRKSRFQRLRGERSRGATARLPLEAREKDHRRRRAKMYGEMVKEVHRPRVSERARREVATRADAVRPGFEDLSRIAPPERRPARRTNTTSTDAASPRISSTRRDGSTSGPRPEQTDARVGGRIPIGTTRARARRRNNFARDATTMRTTTGTTGTTVSSGTTGTTGRRVRPRGRLRGRVVFARRRWTTSTTIRGGARGRRGDGSASAPHRGEVGGVTVGDARRGNRNISRRGNRNISPRLSAERDSEPRFANDNSPPSRREEPPTPGGRRRRPATPESRA